MKHTSHRAGKGLTSYSVFLRALRCLGVQVPGLFFSTLLALRFLTVSASAALQSTVAVFDTPGSVDGWVSDNTRVTLSNPGGWLEMGFKAQLGPCLPEQCRAYADTNTLGGIFVGNYVSRQASEIRFDFSAVNVKPSLVWVSLMCGSGREWFIVVTPPDVGTWGSYVIPVAYKAGWLYSPIQTEQMFWDDMRDVKRVGVFVSRSATAVAESYKVDNFGINAGPGLDSDHDGMNDMAEMSAGTDPYAVASVLRLAAAEAVDEFVVVKWASVADRTYTILSTTNMFSDFLPLATGLPGTPPVNVYTDTTAIGIGPYFYKVGVEP